MSINLETGQRCSEITRGLEVDSAGTALRTNFFITIDIPLPWPKPVFDHEFLAGVTELLNTYSIPVRVLASVPEDRERLTATVYELKQDGCSQSNFLNRTHWVYQEENLLSFLKNVLEGKEKESFKEIIQNEEIRELWICTQGSHDICCGSEGTALSLEANMNLPNVKVRRVSHLGGHRFAPTAVTFPDGRMWSHLNMENLLEIFDEKPIKESLLKKCRGWCGSETGPEQIAEREGLDLYGWNWNKYQRKTAIISEEMSETKVLVTGFLPDVKTEVKFEVVIDESGKTPILSCDQVGGIPTKWQTLYEVKKVDVQ